MPSKGWAMWPFLCPSRVCCPEAGPTARVPGQMPPPRGAREHSGVGRKHLLPGASGPGKRLPGLQGVLGWLPLSFRVKSTLGHSVAKTPTPHSPQGTAGCGLSPDLGL